jgi:protein TonB
MGFSASRSLPAFPFPEAPWRMLTLTAIVVLHLAALYAIRGGLSESARPAEAAPLHEVVATFVTPAPAPAPLQPAAAPRPVPAKPTPPVKKHRAPQPKPAAKAPAPAAVREPTPPADPAPAAPAPPVPPAPASAPASASSAPAAAPVSAAPAVPAAPKTITSGVQYLQPPRPDYPPLSRRLGEQGRAVLRVLINAQGQAERIELQHSSGSARLDEAARQAVLRAVFQPYLENGRPVPVFALIPISFQLD